jgi:DNA polymerase III subunit beta
MKFIINKNDFQNVLSKVQGLTGRKSTLAITTSVLMQSGQNGVKITATDLETGYEGFFPANVSQTGTIALNSKKLLEIVRDFPNENISIQEVDNHWIEIGTTNVEYHIVGMDASEFPPFPKIDNVSFFEMDAKKLNGMIEKMVIITGSSEEKRPHILGSFFEIINNDAERIIRMVSTDGNRLSTVDCVMDKNMELPPEAGYIIPKKGLTELNKFIGYEGGVKIGFKDNYLISKKKSETVVIRLFEGDFPRYREILANKGEGNLILFNRQQLTMMLKRMSILSSEDYKSVIFNFMEDRLIINSTNPDIGESKEEMEIVFKGDPIEVAFNPRYFMETLNCIEDESIEMNIIDEEKPCFIQGTENKEYLSVIMPMRL